MLDGPDERGAYILIVHADYKKGGNVSYQASSFANATHQRGALCEHVASDKQ